MSWPFCSMSWPLSERTTPLCKFRPSDGLVGPASSMLFVLFAAEFRHKKSPISLIVFVLGIFEKKRTYGTPRPTES